MVLHQHADKQGQTHETDTLGEVNLTTPGVIQLILLSTGPSIKPGLGIAEILGAPIPRTVKVKGHETLTFLPTAQKLDKE